MKNRESLYPGRIKLTPVDAANGIYDLVRADEPQEEGTPLNKALLDYAVAACGVTAGTATALTLDDAFGGFTLVDGAKVNFRLHVASGANPTLNVNSTGAKALKTVLGDTIPNAIPAGMWVTATYSKISDAYSLDGVGGRVAAGTYIGDGGGISNITMPFAGTNGVYAQAGSTVETSRQPRDIVLPFEPSVVLLYANNMGLVSTVYNGSPKTAYVSGNVTTYQNSTTLGNGSFSTAGHLLIPCMEISKNVLKLVGTPNITPAQAHPSVTSTVLSNVKFSGFEDTGADGLGGYNAVGVKYNYIAY